MDEALKTTARIFLAAACTLTAGLACAQALQDPTRPPALLMANARGAAGGPVAVEGPRLQSILIARTPGGRHVAVIDGEMVRLGDSVKGARVERMTQTEVVLSKGGKKQVLKLFPTAAAGENTKSVQQ
jgi:MSHA biogenesis protein MshK